MEYHTFFILASGYWLPDYMKDYEIQLRWYCKLACITEKKKTLFGVLHWLSGKQTYNEIIWCRNLAVWQDFLENIFDERDKFCHDQKSAQSQL